MFVSFSALFGAISRLAFPERPLLYIGKTNTEINEVIQKLPADTARMRQ
jgi:hypothetical protein